MKKNEILSDAIGMLPENTVSGESIKRRGGLRIAVKCAAAACLCAAVMLSLFSKTGDENYFAVKAYELDVDDDGNIALNEKDLVDFSEVWGGYCDGERFYVNVGLGYEGENIESVEFATESGHFAVQHGVPMRDVTLYASELDNAPVMLHVPDGDEVRVALCGTEFEDVGDRITLDGGTMPEDTLLFWGCDAADTNELPKKLEFTATATFSNGETQTIPVSIDLSGSGLCVSKVPDLDTDAPTVGINPEENAAGIVSWEDVESFGVHDVTEIE